jgi:predicted helicase
MVGVKVARATLLHGNRRENDTDWALRQLRTHYCDDTIGKWDIFYYVYGLLHYPGYRTKIADNLKRELPRIPFAPSVGPACRAGPGTPDDATVPPGRRDLPSGFWAFVAAGQELAGLHLDYEKLPPCPLTWLETESVPLSYRVEDKMRLSKDKTALRVNASLTLAGIPAETFAYRLGNRSALEWVIDQYQVREDPRSGIRSDPNRPDDPEYIVRLVGQVVRVSLERAHRQRIARAVCGVRGFSERQRRGSRVRSAKQGRAGS